MRDNLDRFYTKDKTVQLCLKELNLNQYDLIIEPSAGNGSFSNKISNCLAFDIAPQANNIIEKDWLTVNTEDLPTHKNLLVVGNPPFGERSALAKTFIKHSINLGAETIAFILPKTFNKRLNQKMFTDEWRLIKIIDLDKQDSYFSLVDEDNIYIPCDFFVWTKNATINPNINLRDVKAPHAETFHFVTRGCPTADFSLNGNNGKVKEINEITNPKAEHYIKVKHPEQIEKIKNQLRSLKFDFKSSVNGGVAWVNQDDIYKAYYQQITNKK